MRLALALVWLAVPARAAVKNPDTLVEAVYWEVESLDPDWSASQYPLFNIYETLVDYEGAGYAPKDLRPRLAAKIPTRENGLISADGLTYRFPIRKGVKFHDGSPLTAEDVRYSLLRFLLSDRAGGNSQALLEPVLGVVSSRRDDRPIEGLYEQAARAVAVENGDVVVRLAKPFAPFLGILANFGRVVSESWCAAHGQWDGGAQTWKRFNDLSSQDALPMTLANGTGPFALERYDPVSREIWLKRNDAYWRGPARLRRALIKSVPDFGARKLMAQAGDADVISASPINAPQLRGIKGVSVDCGLRKLQTPISFFFQFNGSTTTANPNVGSGRLDGQGIPPDFFSDKDVRRGFSYAFDYDAYLRQALRGEGARPTGLIPPGLRGPKARAPAVRFDLGQAEAHLKRAWAGDVWKKGFRFTLALLEGDDVVQAAALMLKKNIESLNPSFRIDLRSLSAPTRTDQLRRRAIPLFFAFWTADYPDAHDIAFPLMHSAGFYPSQLGYSNPRADRLVERAAGELDEAKRGELYDQLEAIMEEDLPYVPIAEKTNCRVQRTWLKGFVFNPAVHAEPYGSVFYDLYKAQ